MASPSSVFTGAMTLGEIAMLSQDKVQQRATLDLYESGHILQDAPMQTQEVNRMDDVRFINNLPGDNWVPFNSDPVVVKGKPTPFSYQLYLIRNLIQVDKRLYRDKNLFEDPFNLNWRAWTQNFSWDFATKFFLNQHAGVFGATNDPNAPIGIRPMLDNPAAWNIPPSLKIDAAGVDMSTAMTAATCGQFESIIESAFYQMSAFYGTPGEGVTIYIPQKLSRRWSQGVKLQGAGGGFDMTQDAFDRRVMKYQGAKLRYPGRRTDQLTEILTTTENANGTDGTSNFCSVYLVKWSTDGLCCWQPEGLKPTAPELNPITKVNYNSVIDWGVGIMPRSIRAVARIYDINVNGGI